MQCDVGLSLDPKAHPLQSVAKTYTVVTLLPVLFIIPLCPFYLSSLSLAKILHVILYA